MDKKSLKIIYVSPLERISYQGRHKQSYTIKTDQGIVPLTTMGKAKEFGTTSTYEFPHNPETNSLVTGLDRNVDNPFHKMSAQEVMSMYALTNDWLDILNRVTESKHIKEQTLFEIRHGVAPDFYTSKRTFNMFNPPRNINNIPEKTYLESLKLTLYPRPNRFSNETPRQELLMKMIYQLPSVIAPNKQVANSAIHDWYISQENEAEMEAAKKNEIIESAVYNLYKLKQEYGQYRAYQVAVVLRDRNGQSLVKGRVSPETVNNKLSRFVQSKDSDQLENISKFLQIMEKFDSIEGREKLEIEYLVQQAVNNNIIGIRDNQFIWYSKAGDPNVYQLGSDFDKVVNFFYKEFKVYNPEAEISNFYFDLEEEVKAKNVWFE
jgi:hypothetical protein